MNQTNWIGAFLVIGFAAYIIANNQLPGYLSVLGLSNSSGSGGTQLNIAQQASAVSTGISSGMAALSTVLP